MFYDGMDFVNRRQGWKTGASAGSLYERIAAAHRQRNDNYNRANKRISLEEPTMRVLKRN